MLSFRHKITNLPEENEYPKLVRDLIPDIIRQEDGKEVRIVVLSDEDFELWLKKKAIEEAHELFAAETGSHIIEEIVDLREILDTLEQLKCISADQVRAVQNEKRQIRGGFDKRLLLIDNPGQQ